LKPWRRFSGEVKRRGGELDEGRGSFKLDLGSPRVMTPELVASKLLVETTTTVNSGIRDEEKSWLLKPTEKLYLELDLLKF
jgi:hypothetical protein